MEIKPCYIFWQLTMVLISWLQISGQVTGPLHDAYPEILMESIQEESGTNTDYEGLMHDLELLRKDPVNLNTATAADLNKLPFLTDFQINSLLKYRQEHGGLLTLYELPMIYGFTEDLVRQMLPYITIGETNGTQPLKMSETVRQGNHEVILRTNRVMEKSRGYNTFDSLAGTYKYPGDAWLYYARYNISFSNRLTAGVTMEKDPGESFFNGSNTRGFDFYSAMLMFTDLGPVKTLVAGDFRLGFGQGLTLWNGAAPSKSSLPLNIVKRNDAIRAYSSADENDFFRGVAAGVQQGKFSLMAFFSSKRRDANITDTSESGRIYFSSFQESGYHRTVSEVTDEKSVRENAFGGHLTFRGNNLKLGLSLVYYHLDKYMEAGDNPEDRYDFKGRSLFNTGFDYSFSFNKAQLFGETAYGNREWATLNGAVIHVNKFASFSLLYRYYGKGYFGLHADAFSEGSQPSNEEAFYIGMVAHAAKHLTISAYADLYRFPWIKSQLTRPSSGSDFLLQADYTAGRNIEMALRLKFESKPGNGKVDSIPMPVSTTMQYTGIRYHISYRLNSKLVLQTRLEMTDVKNGEGLNSQGFMIYQNLEYKPMRLPLSIALRFAWFQTDDYNSRIYAYEQDLISGFSFSPLSEEGYRTYLLFRYSPTKQLSFSARVSRTFYDNKESIGSGYDEIANQFKNDIKLQATFRF